MWNLSSCSYESTTVWLHHLDFREMLGEKIKWELYNDDDAAACCFAQILEAAPYKIAAERPLTSHHTNHPSKMNNNMQGTDGEVRMNS